MCAKRIRAEKTQISRTGELPIPGTPRQPGAPPPLNPNALVNLSPEELAAKRADLEAKAAIAIVLFDEHHNYHVVADLLGVPTGTVRGWVFKAKHNREPGELSAADLVERLKNTAPLALARVQEALTEMDDHKDAANIGLKVLHGLGHLRTHQATKHEGPAMNTNLTVTFTTEHKGEAQAVVEGSVVGNPRLTAATDAEVEE